MNRWLRLALQILSLLTFGFILWWAGPEPWRQILAGDRPPMLTAFVLHGLASIVSAMRLRLVTQALAGQQVASWRRFYYLNSTVRALGLVLPRSISGVGGKSVSLRALGAPLKLAVWVVLVDNLFDVFLLALLAIPAVFFLQTDLEAAGFFLISGGLLLLFALAAWWGTAEKRLTPLFRWLRRIPWLAGKLNPDTDAHLLPTPNQSLAAVGWTVLLHGILATSFYAMGQAVKTPASWPLVFAGYPLAQLSLIIAIAPGGLGIFDLGWLGLLRLGGVSENEALTFVVAQRAYVSLFVLFWAAFSALLLVGKPDRQSTNQP